MKETTTLPSIKVEFKERDRLRDGANYDVWAIRMRGFLKESTLWDIVDGTETRPAPPERMPHETRAPPPTPEMVRWDRMDEKAQSLIRTGLSESMVISTSSATSSKEMWDILQAVYRSNDLMTKMSASTKFYSLKMREGEPVDQFVSNFRLLRLKLAQCGTVITERDAVIRLLSALPPSYSSFVTSQSAILRLAQQMELEFLTVNAIIWALLQEEMIRSSQKSHGKNHVLYTAKSGGKDFRWGNTKNPQGQSGSPVNAGSPKTTPKRVGNCRWCGLPNHWERNCKKKRAGEPRKVPIPEAYVASKKDRPSPSVLLTMADMRGKEICVKEQQVLTICLIAGRPTKDWFVDSGATSHICQDKNLFVNYRPESAHSHVLLSDNTKLKILGEGDIYLRLQNNEVLQLSNVLHVPDIIKNLISVRQLVCEKQYSVRFENGICNIYRAGHLLAETDVENDLYVLRVNEEQLRPEAYLTKTITINSDRIAELWHQRLGHPSKDKMVHIMQSDLYQEKFTGRPLKELMCEPCVLAKHHKFGFPKASSSRATVALQLVHSDICGPVSSPSLGGGRYFINFIDDYSRFCWTYIMKHKSEALEHFKDFQLAAERQSGKKLVVLRTDNGGEYDSQRFQEYCTS